MVRMLIGPDSTGYPGIKITNDADDPRTTPDSERWKFRYNSKYAVTMNLGGMQRVNQITRPGLNDSGVLLYYPPGSNNGNFVYCEISGGGQSHWCFKKEHFPQLRYDVPLYDIKAKKGGGSNRYNQHMVFWHDSYDYYNGQGGSWVQGTSRQLAWVTGTNSSFFNNIFGAWASGIIVQITRFDTIDGFNQFLSRDRTLVVWNLPGNRVPVDEAPALAPNGSKVVVIGPNDFKTSRPGYPVDTATPAQTSFDAAAKLPVKVIRSGDIALPAGVSYFDVGFQIPEMVALDVHFYNSGTIMYPSNPQTANFGAEYWFDGTRIGFDASTNMRARFMLYLADNSPPTSGVNRVFRPIAEGGQNALQVLRPGAADPPAWPDIVIDSRYPQVQIIKDGWIDVVAGNGVYYDIPFDGNGMFPMVKYLTEHGGGRGGSAAPEGQNQLNTTWTSAYRLPFIKRLRYTAPGNQLHAGESTYCELTQNNARFWTFAGNVGDYYNRRDSPGSWRTAGATPPIAIRYYIFGIPA